MTIELEQTAAATSEKTSLASLVGKLAGILRHGGGTLSAGDIASLRRMDPERPSAAFFKLLGVALEGSLPSSEEARFVAETRWAAIVAGLAHLNDLHVPHIPLGRALALAGLSELRFDRLLRADAERLIDELPTIARLLAAKGVAADWTDAARLLFSAPRRDAETVRRAIARSYFSALADSSSH